MKRLLPVLAVVGFVFCLVVPAAVAQELTADDYMDLFKPLAGMWKSTATAEAKTVEGTWLCRLSRTGKCLVTYGSTGVLPAGEAIHGYDPAAKQWKITTYDADGGFSMEVLTVKDMKKGKELSNGHTSTSAVKRYLKDGTAKNASYTLIIIAYEKDKMEVLITDRKEDGQAQPDFKLVMERQQRRGRGAKQ